MQRGSGAPRSRAPPARAGSRKLVGDSKVLGYVTESPDDGGRHLDAMLDEVELQFGGTLRASLEGIFDANTGSVGFTWLDRNIYGATGKVGTHDRTTIAINPTYPAWLGAITLKHEYEHWLNVLSYPYHSSTIYDTDPSTALYLPHAPGSGSRQPNPCGDCNHNDIIVQSAVDILERACDDPAPSSAEWCQMWNDALAAATKSSDACRQSDCPGASSLPSASEQILAKQSAQGGTCPGFSCSEGQ